MHAYVCIYAIVLQVSGLDSPMLPDEVEAVEGAALLLVETAKDVESSDSGGQVGLS